MTDSKCDLTGEIERLMALLAAERAEKQRIAVERDAARSERNAAVADRDRFAAQNERLAHMLRQLRRKHFAKRSTSSSIATRLLRTCTMTGFTLVSGAACRFRQLDSSHSPPVPVRSSIDSLPPSIDRRREGSGGP